MALELTLKKTKAPVYPTKSTINLVTCDQKPVKTQRNIIVFAIAVVAIALFAKFGVIDVMAQASASAGRLASAQSQLSQLEANNANYNELRQQYETYVINSLSDEEKSLVDRGAVLNLLQSTVANIADLQTVSISGNEVQLQFVNTSLEDTSKVVASLENNQLVSAVALSTAKTDKNDDVVSTVTITLKSATEVKGA